MSTGQLRGEITRQSVIGRQHLGAPSHINETLHRERKTFQSQTHTFFHIVTVYEYKVNRSLPNLSQHVT